MCQMSYKFPVPGDVPDALSEEKQGDPEEYHSTTNGSHGAKSSRIAALCNPIVGIEAKEKAEASCILSLVAGPATIPRLVGLHL